MKNIFVNILFRRSIGDFRRPRKQFNDDIGVATTLVPDDVEGAMRIVADILHVEEVRAAKIAVSGALDAEIDKHVAADEVVAAVAEVISGLLDEGHHGVAMPGAVHRLSV